MNKLIPFLALLCVALACRAQEDAAAADQRKRIAAERTQVESDFLAQEKLCYRKFAVTDCLNAAKAQRRAGLADLRRQEVSLNDAERKRKGSERVRDIEERATPKREAGLPAVGGTPQSDRQIRSAQTAAERASSDASRPAKAAERTGQVEHKKADAARAGKAAQERQNLKAYEQRQSEAEERKAALDKRLAEQNKPPAKSLPVPP